MAVRDFVDRHGVSWRVWPVSTTIARPTAAEDYLKEYGDGWLCFESEKERRRLAVFPPDWADVPDDVLETLLDRAVVDQTRRTSHLGPEIPGEMR